MEFDHKRFFALLQECLGEQYNMHKWVAEVLKCTELTAWRKINGERGLQIAEMLKLIAAEPQLGIVAAELFPWHQLKVVQLRSFRNEEHFHSYLHTIYDMLRQASEREDFRLRYMARDLPLFFFLGSTEVLKHKFKLWTQTDLKAHVLLSPDTLKLAGELYALYQSIPTEEIWYDQAFAHQFRQLAFLLEAGELQSAEAEEMKAYFEEEAEKLEWAVRSCKKAKGGELLAADCPLALNNNGALLQSGGKEQLLGSIMSAQYFYSGSPRLIEQFKDMWTQHLRWCDEVPERMLHLDWQEREARKQENEKSA